MISIRELHLLAFGERIAQWYDEACDIWRNAYGRPDDPPVLLLSSGGFAGYGRALADAGPTPIDGQLTHYLVRLFANEQTQGRMCDDQFRRDLIAHELGHVDERTVSPIKRAPTSSTHDSSSWRNACAIATPYMLPELADVAASLGVTLSQVFSVKASRVLRVDGKVTRMPVAGAIPVKQLASWPHSFREAAGRAAFVSACHAVTTTLERNNTLVREQCDEAV